MRDTHTYSINNYGAEIQEPAAAAAQALVAIESERELVLGHHILLRCVGVFARLRHCLLGLESAAIGSRPHLCSAQVAHQRRTSLLCLNCKLWWRQLSSHGECFTHPDHQLTFMATYPLDN